MPQHLKDDMCPPYQGSPWPFRAPCDTFVVEDEYLQDFRLEFWDFLVAVPPLFIFGLGMGIKPLTIRVTPGPRPFFALFGPGGGNRYWVSYSSSLILPKCFTLTPISTGSTVGVVNQGGKHWYHKMRFLPLI